MQMDSLATRGSVTLQEIVSLSTPFLGNRLAGKRVRRRGDYIWPRLGGFLGVVREF